MDLHEPRNSASGRPIALKELPKLLDARFGPPVPADNDARILDPVLDFRQDVRPVFDLRPDRKLDTNTVGVLAAAISPMHQSHPAGQWLLFEWRHEVRLHVLPHMRGENVLHASRLADHAAGE